MANNRIKNNPACRTGRYILYSINVEDTQNVANPPGRQPYKSVLAGTGEAIDRDLTDGEIKKVEERLGDYLPDLFVISFFVNFANFEREPFSFTQRHQI